MGLFYNYNFNIRIIEKTLDDKVPFLSTKGKVVKEILSDTGLFSRQPECILADPFLVVKDGCLFLFYECQVGAHGKGVLKMTRTRDLQSWTEPREVLNESFHLSFPNVFEDNGEWYMIPETGGDGSITIYKAADGTLEHWERWHTIKKDGQMWADSTILKKEGVYYLFTCIYRSRKDIEMRLFTADSLDGEYMEHPCSPITTDLGRARNAGRLFACGRATLRPCQDCSLGYGKQLSVMRVSELTPTTYREEMEAKHILDKDDPFFRYGGHHFCPQEFLGRQLVAVDAKQRNYNIRELIDGRINHLRKRSR